MQIDILLFVYYIICSYNRLLGFKQTEVIYCQNNIYQRHSNERIIASFINWSDADKYDIFFLWYIIDIERSWESQAGKRWTEDWARSR